MRASGFLLKLVASTVKVYKRMPMKISSPLLSKMYFTFLNSGENRSIVTKMIEGVNYELDLKEVIDSAMYYEGTREPGTSHALKTLCKRGDVVLDVGANVGSHSLPLASHVGEDGRVYAFEPVPWAIKKLKRNLALNKFNNLTIESIALSDIEENEVEMEFRASFKVGSKSGVGQDGKIDNGWWSECERVKVRMATLDSYVKSHQINRLDLIKLDVDGFEGKVIRGALGALKRFQPVLIMEIAPAWTEMRGDSIADIIHELDQLGYKFYKEENFERIHDLSQLVKKLPPAGGFNVVASVRDLFSEVL
jgi:FkbM family methyltransferase